MSLQQSCAQESLYPKNLSFVSLGCGARIFGLSALVVCCLLGVAPTVSAAPPTDDTPRWIEMAGIPSPTGTPATPGQNDEEDPDELELEADPYQVEGTGTTEAVKGWFLGLMERLWGWLADADPDAPESQRAH